jgi:hypothetical protein
MAEDTQDTITRVVVVATSVDAGPAAKADARPTDGFPTDDRRPIMGATIVTRTAMADEETGNASGRCGRSRRIPARVVVVIVDLRSTVCCLGELGSPTHIAF